MSMFVWLYEGYIKPVTDFYNAKQDTEWSVTTWDYRLEDVLGRAVENESICISSVNDMLRTKLWSGFYLKEPLHPKRTVFINCTNSGSKRGRSINKLHDQVKKTPWILTVRTQNILN